MRLSLKDIENYLFQDVMVEFDVCPVGAKMECFVIIVNGWKPLTIITKHSILDVATALDPPLYTVKQNRASELL